MIGPMKSNPDSMNPLFDEARCMPDQVENLMRERGKMKTP
jgi:hypothetical protein